MHRDATGEVTNERQLGARAGRAGRRRTCIVTRRSSTMTSFVRKSAPIVALYWLLKRLLTYWFMSDVLPTLGGHADRRQCGCLVGQSRRAVSPGDSTTGSGRTDPESPRMMTWWRARGGGT